MIIQLGLQILLPIGLMVALARSRYRSRIQFSLEAGVFTLAILFTVLTARWDMTSIHLRWVVGAGLIVAAAIAYGRIDPADESEATAAFLRVNGLNMVLIGALTVLNLVVLSGMRTPADPIDLDFPLEEGTFLVGGGGTSRWINNHVAFPPQNFAVDIIGLNRLGNRGTILPSSDLDDYSMFGAVVTSPCRGRVAVSVDGLDDLSPPDRDTDNLAGNHVVVSCEGVDVLLAHLGNGTVMLSPGDSVRTGQPIGRVGNSGNTSQPHLHVHAERGGEAETILDGEGVPVTFNGRFLVRNSVIRTSGL